MPVGVYTPAEAADLLLSRRAARARLEEFCAATMRGYIRAEHHREVCEAIDKLIAGTIKRLIIEKPPRHGKSFHVSERLPALFLGLNPDKHIITASHGDKMARRFGRKVRQIVGSPEYRLLFPNVTMNPRVDAADEFETNHGGRYIATGINGGYMGVGAHLLGIDDPFKSRKEADSQIVRDMVWESYGDLETRLEPGAVLYVLHTRWHEDDLIGRIEDDRIKSGIEDWVKITQPMILNECERWEQVEKGEGSAKDEQDYEQEHALWAERFDLDACRAIRRKVPRRTWVSLYQQKPSSKEGDKYRRDWFQRYDVGEQPRNLSRYVISDFATKKDDGDWTEFYGVGIDFNDHIWFEECWFGQEQADIWIPALVDLLLSYKPFAFFGESGQIKSSLEPFIRMALESKHVYVLLVWLASVSDKVSRSRASCGIASMRRFHIPRCDWGDRLIEQLVAFPTSNMDHSVDAVSQIGRALEDATSPMRPAAPEQEERRDSWQAILNRDRGFQNWKTA